jgi:hypothetical protein
VAVAVQGLGFGVIGFRVQGLGFRVILVILNPKLLNPIPKIPKKNLKL